MSTTSRDLATKATRRTVGVRDAKARLSELLRDAQLGHEWTITERGKPIARIVPVLPDVKPRPRLPSLKAFRATMPLLDRPIEELIREERDRR